MTPVRILVDSLADQGLTNSQMTNAREIIRRLDPSRFHVSVFCGGVPDRIVAERPNTRLISLPQRRRTVRILREFLLGRHDILFYVKSAPASRLYLGMAKGWKDRRITIGNRRIAIGYSQRADDCAARRCFSGSRPCCAAIIFSATRSTCNKVCNGNTTCPARSCPRVWTPVFLRRYGTASANSRPRVLFVGSLRPFKQPQLLLDAAARFPERRFCACGRRPDGGRIESADRARATQKRHAQRLVGGGAVEAAISAGGYFSVSLTLGRISEGPAGSGGVRPAGDCTEKLSAGNCSSWQTGYLVGSDDELFARLRGIALAPGIMPKTWRGGPKAQLNFSIGIPSPAAGRKSSSTSCRGRRRPAPHDCRELHRQRIVSAPGSAARVDLDAVLSRGRETMPKAVLWRSHWLGWPSWE